MRAPLSSQGVCSRSPISNPSTAGCILQFYVLLKTLKDADGANTSSFMSLLISALSTGYSSATITWDFDTSTQRRRELPEFYGMIPDGPRGNVVFLCMILNSALLLLVRSLSYALLMLVKPAYVLYYALGDTIFFFLQKIARGDLKAYPNIDGLAGAFAFDFLGQILFMSQDLTDAGVVDMCNSFMESSSNIKMSQLGHDIQEFLDVVHMACSCETVTLYWQNVYDPGTFEIVGSVGQGTNPNPNPNPNI